MKIPEFINKINTKIKDSWVELSKQPSKESDNDENQGPLIASFKRFLVSYPKFFFTVAIYTISPFIIAFIIYIILTSGKATVKVPQLQGLSMMDAANLLQVNQLRPTYLSIDSDEYPNYFIVSQDIKAGRKVKVGRDIILYVSESGDVHQFPDYTGKNLTLVKSTIEQTDTNIKKIFINNIEWVESDLPFEQIIEQSPQNGSYKEFPIGISFKVSRGKKRLLPNFSDQSIGEALFYIHNNGLKATIETKEVKDPQLSGKILAQNPNSETPFSETTYIYLTVGKYKDLSRYFFYSVPEELDNQTIQILFKDNKGEKILFQGTVKKGDILLPATQVFGDFDCSIYIIKDENKELYKELLE